MTAVRTENVVGALSLALADDLLRTAQSHLATAAPAAALTLVSHAPGMTIDQLRHALGLSHPGAVRLVDRLENDGLLMRGRSAEDGRAVALTLTASGAALAQSILTSRQSALARALDSLSPSERETLGRLAETMLRAMLKDENHAFEVCRLCDPAICNPCPVTDEMVTREAHAESKRPHG